MSIKSSMPRIKKKRRVAGEGWVSYNRVLIGNNASKKNIGRNPNFDTDETKLLIQLWGDPKVQRTLITTHKKHSVICQLASRMQEHGYYRSPEEITTRIKNLKCFYNRLKKDMDSGQSLDAEPTWRHFAEMDAIMTRPIFSVRPNEVPQPSLKYQMEQKRQEREEHSRKVTNDDSAVNKSEDNNEPDNGIAVRNNKQEIDDGIIPDVEVDMDINDETFAAITAVEVSAVNSVSTSKITNGEIEIDEIDGDNDDDDDGEENSLQIKEEEENEDDFKIESNKSACKVNTLNQTRIKSIDTKIKSKENNEFLITKPTSNTKTNTISSKAEDTLKNDAVLIIPKEEPIDIENDFENFPNEKRKSIVGRLMPTLAEMLKISKCNNLSPTKSATSPASNLNTFSNVVLTSFTSAQTATFSPNNLAQSNAPSSGSKISLVPASFLLSQSTTPTPTATLAPPLSPAATLTPSSAPTAIACSTTLTPQVQLLSNARSNTTAQIPRLVSAAPAGIVATGPGGMKVLLVNADHTDGKSTLQQKLQLQTTVGQQQQFHQILHTQTQSTAQHPEIPNLQEEKQRPKRKSKPLPSLHPRTRQQQHQNQTFTILNEDEDIKCKELSPIPNHRLICQLHDAIEENNNIQRKRLRLENERLNTDRSALDIQRQSLALNRDRFEFEKNAFERLLGLFSNVHHQQFQSQSESSVAATVAPTATMMFNSPKMIFSAATRSTFATSIHSAEASAAIAAPANNVAAPHLTSNDAATVVSSQMENCPPENKFQLVTPKLEREE